MEPSSFVASAVAGLLLLYLTPLLTRLANVILGLIHTNLPVHVLGEERFLHICQNFMANAGFKTPNKSLDLLLWSSYQWGGESGELVEANLVLLHSHRPFQSCSNSVNFWTHMWSIMNSLQKGLLNASHTTSSAIAT